MSPLNKQSSVDPFVKVDTFFDKIPLLSSLTNLFEIVAKAVLWCSSKISFGKELLRSRIL